MQTSNDGAHWDAVYAEGRAAGACSYIYLPGTVSRYLRLYDLNGPDDTGIGIVDIDVQPYEFSRSIHTFFQHIARREARGLYPKYWYGEQTYWSAVGLVEAGVGQALLNEEGMLEVDGGHFSIEPFVFVDGTLITWADVSPAQALAQGYLPLPSSEWRKGSLGLTTRVCAVEDAGMPVLYICYRIENAGNQTHQVRFFVALRPFQVTPPWQAFNDFGGASPIRRLASSEGRIWVNDNRVVMPLTMPSQFGAAAFAHVAGRLSRGYLLIVRSLTFSP